MSILPDEIWTSILHTISTPRDLCSVSIVSRRLRRLASSRILWSTLLSHDFPTQTLTLNPTSTPKSVYMTLFEKDKARRVAARRREVMYAESRVAECERRVREVEKGWGKEVERLKKTVEELKNLERARRASVALNVWQPEVIRGRQKQIVEQCAVPIESHRSALEMEVRLCKQQIATYKKTYNDQKRKLSDYKEALTSLQYQPLKSNQSSVTEDDCTVKRKKKKRSDCHDALHKNKTSLQVMELPGSDR